MPAARKRVNPPKAQKEVISNRKATRNVVSGESVVDAFSISLLVRHLVSCISLLVTPFSLFLDGAPAVESVGRRNSRHELYRPLKKDFGAGAWIGF
jgi:hypothetical protein